jgi:citrate lyase subunit beta/citryl-CoA lyase
VAAEPGAGLGAERPVRSLLFVPGNRPAWFAKAVASGADGLIIDLQDAVPPNERQAAYQAVAAFITERQAANADSPVLLIRVSAVDDPAFADCLQAVVRTGTDGIVLPMVNAVDDVRVLSDRLAELEAAAGIERPLRIVPLMETALALQHCFDIFACSPRVAYAGGSTARGGDLARSLGFEWTPEGLETLYLRSQALLAARAAGVSNPISGMWGAVDDVDGLRAFAGQTRQLGYRGMMVIHPSHVAVVNEVFSPTPQQISGWRRTIEEMARLHESGAGTGRLDGELIDAAHAATAEVELARAEAFGLLSAG